MEGEGLRTVELSLKDLQTRFKKHTITATLQCTGNRRDDLNTVKPVKGLEWSVGAPASRASLGMPVQSRLTGHTASGLIWNGLQAHMPAAQYCFFVHLSSSTCFYVGPLAWDSNCIKG